MRTIRYNPHKLAEIFPPMSAEEMADLVTDIAKNGLRQPIVLYEGAVLDGVHRQEACVRADVTPKYIGFDDLRVRGGPVSYVVSTNLRRRHLTASQRAAIAVDVLPFFEAEAKKRQGKRTDLNGTLPSKDGNVEKGTAAAQAAKATGASETMVERANRLKKESPEEFEKVKAGKVTISKTEKAKQRAAAAREQLEAAHARIAKVCDKGLADAIRDGGRLPNPKDVILFASLDDAEMKRVGRLIGVGCWKLKKAILFREKNLTPRHSIADLCHWAYSKGGRLSVDIGRWHIDVKRLKRALS